MAAKRIFVGRQEELEQFAQVLADPQGQAILVVGQAGMGKSWVIQEMVARAENGTLFRTRPGPKCWAVSYEIRPTDSVNRIVEQIVIDASEAARPVRRKLGMTGDKKDKWRALFGTAGLVPVLGPGLQHLGELFLTFGERKTGDPRDNFVQALQRMSEYMAQDQRAMFVVDPDKTMPPGSDHLWRSVVQELPERIKLVFAQRPHDVLVNNLEFCALANVIRVPGQRDQMDGLQEEAVEELADAHARMTGQSGTVLRDAVQQYKGHAYSTVAGLDLLGQGTKPEALPKDPKGIAAAQWKEIGKAGKDAIHLFKAYAILQVPVPDEVVIAVARLDPDTHQSLAAHDYLGGLVRREDGAGAIYHALLVDHILGQIANRERRTYHQRAAETYRERLHAEPMPDCLAAEQLPGHVLEAEGPAAFVETLISLCTRPLLSLGRLDTLIQLSQMAMQRTQEATADRAAVTGNLGLVYQTQGDLAEAEKMYRQALEINNQLGRRAGIAASYGNLGSVYQDRGDLAQAEQMYRQALAIEERLGRREGIANAYGNLGVVYKTRGDLAQAEQMCRKALAIEEQLGRRDSVADSYVNLGVVHHTRGDLAQAEQMYRKALAIDEQLGRWGGVATICGNLGVVYKTRGDLELAEQIYRKALAIEEGLGQRKGMATNYANLGNVHQSRGDLERAREYWEKAIELYEQIGMPHMVEKVQGSLAELEAKE